MGLSFMGNESPWLRRAWARRPEVNKKQTHWVMLVSEEAYAMPRDLL